MTNNKTGTIFRISSLISRPLKIVISISAGICGLNIFGIITAFGVISTKKEFFEKNYNFLLGSLFTMICIIIIAFIIISIGLCIALLCNPCLKDFSQNISDCSENCLTLQTQLSLLEEKNKLLENLTGIFSLDIDKLYGLVAEMEIAGNIINKKKLMDIEKSVPRETDIIILSSKYKLDEEFKPIVINNIKKGIVYKYIVSGANKQSPKHVRFLQVVKSWYSAYIETNNCIATDIKRKPKGRKVATHPTVDYDKQFYDHIQEFPSPFENDILTIMLYRKKNGNYNYDVIVNLPSEKKEYFSYKLSDNSSETGELIDSILSICKEEKRYHYKL